jgi:hypothetical protein
MVKPGGTGKLMLVISARLAPLPPSKFFMSARPSARPFPKKYTYFSAIASSLDSMDEKGFIDNEINSL